jgi:hypothetical protein
VEAGWASGPVRMQRLLEKSSVPAEDQNLSSSSKSVTIIIELPQLFLLYKTRVFFEDLLSHMKKHYQV